MARRSGRQVWTRGVAEAAHPVHVRIPCVARDLRLEHREDVGADDVVPVALVPGHLTRRGVEAQRDVVIVEYADQRTSTYPVARAAPVEPEHPVATGETGLHGFDDGLTGGLGHGRAARNVRTMSTPWL